MDLALGIAILGTAGFLADVVLHIANGRRISSLEARVEHETEVAREERALILTRSERVEKFMEALASQPEPGSSPQFAHGAIDPAEARARRDEVEVTKLETEAALMEALGPDVVAMLRAANPTWFNRILKYGPGAVGLAKKAAAKWGLASKSQGASSSW